MSQFGAGHGLPTAVSAGISWQAMWTASDALPTSAGTIPPSGTPSIAGPEILRYVVEKGSITIDGISLTVAAVDDEGFSVSTIPHTVAQTNLNQRGRGDPVNLETDMVGKYIEKLLRPEDPKPHTSASESTLTTELLLRCGF